MIKKSTHIYVMKKVLSCSLIAVMLLTSLLGGMGAVKMDRVQAIAYAPIRYFEHRNPVIEIEVEAGTAAGDLDLPESLRAVFEFTADISKDINEITNAVTDNETGNTEVPADEPTLNKSPGDYTENVTFTTDNNLTFDSAEDNGAPDSGSPDNSMVGEIIGNENTAEENASSPDNNISFRQTKPKIGYENGNEYFHFKYIAPDNEEELRENGYLVIYDVYNEGVFEGSRIHGTYNGQNEGFYDYDIENKNIIGIVSDILVTWEGKYDPYVPGTYILAADFALYDNSGKMPTVVVTVNPFKDEFAGILMEAPNSIEITSGLLSQLAVKAVDESFWVGTEEWIVVRKHQEAGETTAIMLTRKGGFTPGAFGTNNTYEGSAIQAFFTNYFTIWTSPLKDIALVPTLGDNTREDITTSPLKSPERRLTLASDTMQTKDIVFAMSRQDMVDWNDGKTTPVREAIRGAFPKGGNSSHVWLRTKGAGRTSAWELNNRGEGPGYITNDANVAGYEVSRVPTVWVQVAGVWRYVNVHYIDTDGNIINPPEPESYQVLYDDTLSLLEDAIPDIPGYIFTEQWKLGAPNTELKAAPVTVENIRKDTDIYLVYENNAEAAVVTVNYIDKATGESIRTPDRYAAVLDTNFTLINFPAIPKYNFTDDWNQDSNSAVYWAPPVTIENIASEESIYLYYEYVNIEIPSVRIGVKNAYINGAGTPQNGTISNPTHVNLEDKIQYKITTVNEKINAISGDKYDVLFVLDWSESMDAHMVPGQSARLYEKDVMLDMSDFILGISPGSRVAVMGMNSQPGLSTNPLYTNIQFESDFLTKDAYFGGGRDDIANSFNIAPQNRTEDLVTFLRAANHKMESVAYNYGSSSVGGTKTTIPRKGDDLDERIPVIIFISDFQIPKGHNQGNYWTVSMRAQSNRFFDSHANSILQAVRFDHNGNHAGGNAEYSTSTFDNLMKANFSPINRPRWGFTKVDRNTPYDMALDIIKTDFLNNTNTEGDRATEITDVVPEGLEVVTGSISHGGEYDPGTRTIKWDLFNEPEGEITVEFTVTVKQESDLFKNTAGITFYDDATLDTNATYHNTKVNPHVDVTISKIVTGDLGDYTKAFEFSVYIIDANGSGLNIGKEFEYTGGVVDGIKNVEAPEDGVLILKADGPDNTFFHLSHGQTITIKDVPANNYIMIIETEDGNYTTTILEGIDGNGKIETSNNHTEFLTVGENNRTFEFFNARKEIVPTGIMDGAGTQAMIALLAFLFILPGVALIKVLKRKIYE